MIIRLEPTEYRNGSDDFYVLHMSDLHLGAQDCDKALIRRDLDWARERGARVLIAGDVLDLLLTKDAKRFHPNVLESALQGRADLVGAGLELAEAVLGPYADLIDMIGVGNHEAAVVKWHSLDVTRLLIERLIARAQGRKPGHVIHHGAYSGVVSVPFRRRCGKGWGAAARWQVFYHHGTTNSAPVTKGMIEFNRFAAWVRDVDAIWLGHLHTRWADHTQELRVPLKGDPYTSTVWHLMTGAYTTGNGNNQLSKAGTYQPHFGVEKGFAPAGPGGIRVRLQINSRTARFESEVIL